MAGRDPVSIARSMAEADLARRSVAKGAGAAPSLGELVSAYLPFATGLAGGMEPLDGQAGKNMNVLAEVGADLRLVAEQDRQRREARAARMAALMTPPQDPQDARIRQLMTEIAAAAAGKAALWEGGGKHRMC